MTTHIAFTPTDEQRANLLRLAAHLDLGVTNLQFDMAKYQNECGTVGCAAGHGPSLGIARGRYEDWPDYASRAFGAHPWDEEEEHAYIWLFAGGWASADNTPRGAAGRIRYALAHGVPDNYWGQLMGEAPLSYTVPDRVEGPTVAVKVSA